MVKQFVITSGHGKFVSGAEAILNEVQEARKVVNRVYKILTEEYNGKGYRYHDNTSTTQNQNLDRIVGYHNSKFRNLDISIHFNSSSESATGTECLYYNDKSLATRVSAAMAKALKIIDRGGKERKELYFLKATKEKAILLEVCFVTSKIDSTNYMKYFEELCQSIAKVISEELGYSKKEQDNQDSEKYYKKGEGIYRIKKNCYAYRGVDFSNRANRVEFCQPGNKYTIVEIVKYGSTFRLKTKSGLYITANKEFVEKV